MLIQGFKRLSVQTHVEEVDDPPILAVHRAPGATGFPVWLVRTALVQALFGASLFLVAWRAHGQSFPETLAASIAAYGVVYLYGLSSITVFAAGLRAIAEHQIGTDGAATVGQAALRNFPATRFPGWSWVPTGSGSTTHHQIPSIPYYHLVEVTADLAKEDPALLPRKGYLQTIRELIASEPATPDAAEGRF